jgi:serine/threonine protein kinase
MAINPAAMGKLPDQLSGYRLIERLGRGGFGEVWKVEAPGGFLKAMKFVFGDLDASEDEGRAAGQELKALHRVKTIRHPYILSLERFDIIEGQLIIVMELADRNLWDRFRECRMAGLCGIPRDELLRYMHETAEALDLMNTHYQIQHLDIKPQNLFLVFDHVKVADFGLAKAFEGARATVTGGVTPVYAGPETFEGYVTRYSDQYSLAIVYQELLTGQRPFNGANTKQLLLQHLRDAPDVSSLPIHDRSIIARALSKTPHDRWPTCAEMVKLLLHAPHSAEAHPVDARALPLPAPKSPISSRANTTGPNGRVSDRTMPATAFQEARSAAFTNAISPVGRGTPTPRPGTGSALQNLLPGLVTPKLVTPRGAAQVAGPALALTQQKGAVVETGLMSELGIAPPPKEGPGVLFPAIVVGIGHSGLAVLQRLREFLRVRFGRASAIPTVRFLYLDTDGDAIAEAGRGDDALLPHELVHLKLNRPAHYLQRDGMPPVDQWLPPGTLYQLPKNPGPADGRRAFGRLAFCDHHRVVAARIRQEIEALLSEDLIEKTAEQTGLGMRTNQARAYIVANIAGGTGGGAFLDAAYLVRHELRQVGYRKPESVGILMVPPADKTTPRAAAANAFAALAEMNHYASGEKYQTRFDTAEPAVIDGQAPFDRTAIFQLPKKMRTRYLNRSAGAVARGLFLELVTPIGRAADYVRSVSPYDPYSGPVVQPMGLYRLSWPRPEILAAITKRFALHLLRRWSERESTHLREPITWWLTDQWAKYRLAPDALLGRLEASVRIGMGESADGVFGAVVNSLKAQTPGSGKLDAMAAVEALDQLVKLVGKPDSEAGATTPSMKVFIEAETSKAALETEAHLSEIAVSFIEQPQYRLAGAEEALNQITARLKEGIESLEAEYGPLRSSVAESFARLFPLIGNLNSSGGFGAFVSRKGAITAELFETLAAYSRKRYRYLIVSAAMTLYRGLLGNIPEYLRDVGYCRTRLESFAGTLDLVRTSDSDAESGAFILPAGCADLNAASDRFIAAMPPDEIFEFDRGLQTQIEAKYGKLVNLCLSPDRSGEFPPMLSQAARAFLDQRLEKANPAEALDLYRGSGPECEAVLAKMFDDAQPTLFGAGTKPPPLEATLLAAPAGPAGDRLRRLASDANPGIEFIPAVLDDDIVLIREYPRMPLAELPQLGDDGRTAYQSLRGADQSPHSRIDVPWRAPMLPAPK